jgi:hypothetical protein
MIELGAKPQHTVQHDEAPPWDEAELAGRNCAACACYFEASKIDDPSKFQGFCRRTPADVAEVRAQVPRLDLQGQPILRDGQPVMNMEKVIAYIYKPTQRLRTCFDGWRAKGTLPGETESDIAFRKMGTSRSELLELSKRAMGTAVKSLGGAAPEAAAAQRPEN